MKRKILIVDDSSTNRCILNEILCDEYEVLDAKNGIEALSVLELEHENVSAVLLDLAMPVMDGYETLARIRLDQRTSELPVIIVTSSYDGKTEMKALALGANDFLAKPYNIEIIKQRLKNTIKLRETAAAHNALRKDELTGLPIRRVFLEKAEKMIAEKPAGYYIMACFDIDGFKVINDQYGTKKGDEVLRGVADIFRRVFEPEGGLVCRVMADNFAVLYPAALADTELLARVRADAARLDGSLPRISFSIGRYVVDDLSLSASAMYDRAALAEASVKGRYDVHIAQYDESMRCRVLHEQRITGEMKKVLETGRFEVWYQPQYNHVTGALIGAEALVRWRQEDGVIMPPCEFIPVFERSGFIYELDKYVWERVCVQLREWLDEGRPPLPVSVNISRYDVFREDFMDTLTGLVEKYRIPMELLRLEITESAFAKSTEQIVEMVKKLIDRGFTIEIDDFGSGYSSLNTLKDVPAQILKLDMRFFEKNGSSDRGGNILESVVRMSKWLGMAVIAEGVETSEQADYLKSIGCVYVQGYLYAKPMPLAEYEALERRTDREEKLLALETVENLDNNSFWDPNSMDTLIFNSYVGAASIVEYNNGRIEMLRASRKLTPMLGSLSMTVEDALKLEWEKYFEKESYEAFDAAIKRSIEANEEVSLECVFKGLPGCPERTYLRITLRVIAAAGNRFLLYCTNENVTAQRETEKKEHRVSEQLKVIMESLNCGVSGVTFSGDNMHYVFANDRYYSMLGYTREQFENEVGNGLKLVHPDDRRRIDEELERLIETGGGTVFEYRAIKRDGEVIHMRVNASQIALDGVEGTVSVGVSNDVTAEKQALEKMRVANERLKYLNEEAGKLYAKIAKDRDLLQTMMDDTPGGFARLRVLPDNTLATEYVNDNFCLIRGMTREEIMAEDYQDAMSSVHPDDVPAVRRAVAKMAATGETINMKYRVRRADGRFAPISVFGRFTTDDDGTQYVNVYYTSLSEQEKKELAIRETIPFVLSAILGSSSDIAFAKDRNFKYICCSSSFVKLMGHEDENRIIGKTDYDLFPRDTAERFRRDDEELMKANSHKTDYVDTVPTDDGTYRFFKVSKYVLRDTLGAVIGIYGSCRDITEESDAYARLKLLLRNIHGGVASYVASPEGLKITYFNDGFCGILGYTHEEYEKIAAGGVTTLAFEEDRPRIAEQVQTLIRDGTPVDCTYRVHTKGGGSKLVNLRGGVSERHGDVCLLNAVLYDMTERADAQRTFFKNCP